MRHVTEAFMVFMLLGLGAGSPRADGADEPPKEEPPAGKVAARDDFDGRLALKWTTVRPVPSHVSLTKHPGELTITSQYGGIFQGEKDRGATPEDQAKNLHLVENPMAEAEDFVLTTCLVQFRPSMKYQQAGLMCYSDDDNYIKWNVESGHLLEGKPYRVFISEAEGEILEWRGPLPLPEKPAPDRLWLRLVRHGSEYEFASSLDGKSYTIHGSGIWPPGRPKRIGLFAKNGGERDAAEIDARFDFFEVRALSDEEKASPLWTDRKNLDGTWEVVTCRVSGEPLSDPPLSRFEFRSGKVTITEDDRAFRSTFEIDPGARPKRLTFGAGSPSDQPGRMVNAGYSLDKDTLVLCFHPAPGAAVPPTLETVKGDGRWLVTLKRAAKDDPALRQ